MIWIPFPKYSKRACGPALPHRRVHRLELTGSQKLREGATKLRQSTDRAIIGLFGGNLLEMGQFLYRNDNFFVLLAGEPNVRMSFLTESSKCI